MRPIITKFIAVLLVVGAFFGAQAIKDSKEKRKPKTEVNISTAFVQPAKNKIIPVSILESGRLVAKNRVDIYAEVQGVMLSSSKDFKPGQEYRKGQVLVKINSEDYRANLKAQKSALQNLITGILPDLKLDYPKAFRKWDDYLKAFDVEKSLKPLPEPSSDKEKFFITGRNIYTSYYNTKNLEIVLKKYTLSAPFNGILTDALVTPGSLVRNGQKLGEFIDPTKFELELALSKALISAISVGKEVTVTNPEDPSQTWTGKVSRINGKVNPSTQTVQVFVLVNGDGLKEGMYLEAKIAGKEKVNAIEISRNLLVDDSKVYVVDADSVLSLKTITVVHKSRKNAIIQGVDNNSWVLVKPIPGAYSGMKVFVNIEK